MNIPRTQVTGILTLPHPLHQYHINCLYHILAAVRPLAPLVFATPDSQHYKHWSMPLGQKQINWL